MSDDGLARSPWFEAFDHCPHLDVRTRVSKWDLVHVGGIAAMDLVRVEQCRDCGGLRLAHEQYEAATA